MANTLLLDTVQWDLVLDANGDIALAEEPYSLAQDASSEVRTFQGECYYNTVKGVPYFQQILGRYPPASIMKTAFANAALLTPNIKSVQVFLALNAQRQLTGQLQITSVTGEVLVSPTGPHAPFVPDFLNPNAPPPAPPNNPLPPPPPPPPPPPGPTPPGTVGEFDFTDPVQSENTGLQ